MQQAISCGDPFSAFSSGMSGAWLRDPVFDGAERSARRFAGARAWRRRLLVEALLDSLENVLVLPARDTPLTYPAVQRSLIAQLWHTLVQ